MTKSSIHQIMTASDWALLVLLSLIWGGSFLFIGVAVKELPPFTIVAARVVVAALALLIVLGFMDVEVPRGRKVWLTFFGMGILNNVTPFCLIVWGQKHIASGLASILNATTPLFTVIVAHFLTADERLTGRKLAGVIVGFFGVAVMIGGAAFDAWGTNVVAQLAILGAAVSYAFSGVYGRRFRTMGISPMATAAGQITASSMILLPLALLADRPWTLPVPSTGTIVSLAALALLSTAFAYIIFFRLLGRAGATNAGLVTFLIPVSAILLGVLILGESLEPRHFAGMALIGAGLILLDGRLPAIVASLFSAKGPAPHENG